jgi:Integral membrane protein S linking to the trans Golgi network
MAIPNGNSVGGILSNGNSSSSTNRRDGGRNNRIAGNRNISGSSSSSSTQHQFYPKLITAQIIALQCFHYSLLAVFFQINHVLYGTSITIDRIFTDQYIRTSGWADTMAILLSSIAG